MLPINETALHFYFKQIWKNAYHAISYFNNEKKPIRNYVEKIPWENVTACIDLLEFSINWLCQLAFFIRCLCISPVWLQLLTNFKCDCVIFKGDYSKWEMFCTILRLCQYSFKKTLHVRLSCYCYRLTFHDAFLIFWRHFRDVSYPII